MALLTLGDIYAKDWNTIGGKQLFPCPSLVTAHGCLGEGQVENLGLNKVTRLPDTPQALDPTAQKVYACLEVE